MIKRRIPLSLYISCSLFVTARPAAQPSGTSHGCSLKKYRGAGATPLRVSSRCTVHTRREGTRSYAIQQEQKRNKRGGGGEGKTRQEVSASGNGQSSLFTTFLAFSSRPPYAPFFSAFIRLHAKYVYVYISLNIIPSFNKSSCFFFVRYMQIRCTNTKV